MYYKTRKHKTRKHKRYYGGLVSISVAEQIAKKRFNLIANAEKAAANAAAMISNVAQKKQAILNRHQQEYEAIEQQKKNATEGAEEFVAYAMKNYNQRYKNKVVPESYRKTRQNAAEKHAKNQINGIEKTAMFKKERANKSRNTALEALDESMLSLQQNANTSIKKMQNKAERAAKTRMSGENKDIQNNTESHNISQPLSRTTHKNIKRKEIMNRAQNYYNHINTDMKPHLNKIDQHYNTLVKTFKRASQTNPELASKLNKSLSLLEKEREAKRKALKNKVRSEINEDRNRQLANLDMGTL